MHLTLESLHNAKNTCSEIKGLESLMNAEERAMIAEQVIAVNQLIDNAITTTGALMQMKGSLEACGYSEDWFDNVNQMGFKDLVQIDMPKFFDNKINRQEVCMEGLMDTIKSWLLKAWDALKKFFGWIRDMAARLVNWLQAESLKNNSKLSWALNEIDKNIDDYLKKKQGVDLNDWFEIQSLNDQVPAINALVEIVSQEYFIVKGITTAEPGNSVNDEMKKDFVVKLEQELSTKGYPTDKVEKTGFIVKNDHNANSVVQFIGVQIKKDFPKVKLQIRSRQSMTMIRDLFGSDANEGLCKKITDSISSIKAADIAIKSFIGTTEKKISQLKTAAVVDQTTINYDRKVVLQANLASQVITGALTFMNKFMPMVSHNRELICKVAEVMKNNA